MIQKVERGIDHFARTGGGAGLGKGDDTGQDCHRDDQHSNAIMLTTTVQRISSHRNVLRLSNGMTIRILHAIAIHSVKSQPSWVAVQFFDIPIIEDFRRFDRFDGAGLLAYTARLCFTQLAGLLTFGALLVGKLCAGEAPIGGDGFFVRLPGVLGRGWIKLLNYAFLSMWRELATDAHSVLAMTTILHLSRNSSA